MPGSHKKVNPIQQNGAAFVGCAVLLPGVSGIAVGGCRMGSRGGTA